MTRNLSPKELSDREQRIEALVKELRTTRAHAASIVDAEEAAKNKHAPTPEELAKQFQAEELKENPEEPTL